jgi:hypothetical protein
MPLQSASLRALCSLVLACLIALPGALALLFV